MSLEAPGLSEVHVRNDWMSVDPYMRGQMRDQPSYVPPFQLGEVLQGGAVGTVIRSNHPDLQPGDTVASMLVWREAFNAPAASLRKVDAARLPPEAYLGMAGLPGLTAYVGLLQAAETKSGDVLFVSAAAGAVGSAACQIARIKGATVIGLAGGPEKYAYLKEIGVDRVIDYKAVSDLRQAVTDVAPDGIDAYFDNAGGVHLEAALAAAKPFARFALCGTISSYNEPGAGPANLFLAVGKRLRLQGFIVSDRFDMMPAFIEEMSAWIGSGHVTWRQTVETGIEQALSAFIKLFTGENLGKMLVRLS